MRRRLDPLALPLAGTRLIEASAGTGKTYTIATLYLRLLLERRLRVGEILVVTFTKAATAELKRRIRARLSQAERALAREKPSGDEVLDALLRRRRDEREGDLRRLEGALRSFDEAAVSTIHGFCQRALRDHAFESGAPFDCELEGDLAPLLREIVDDFWTRELAAAPAALVRHLRRAAITPESLMELAWPIAAEPRIEVLAPPGAEAASRRDLEAVAAAYEAARARAAELWRAGREEVLALLLSPALKKNLYREKTVRETWPALLDALFASPGFDPKGLPLAKLTPEGLRAGTKKDNTAPEHPFFAAAAELLTAGEALSATLEAWSGRLRLDLVETLRREIPRRQLERGTQSFDDLLHRLDAALGRPGGERLAGRLARRFRAALIDEFQDTDPLQYAIFRRIYPPRRPEETALFLIGDPKQAIYSFRGADLFAYLRAAGDADAVYTLGENWRSEPELVRAVERVVGRPRRPFLYERIALPPVRPARGRQGGAERPAGAPLEILWLPSELAEAGGRDQRIGSGWAGRRIPAALAREIAGTIRRREARAGEIAVLCRSNLQARRVQEALHSLGVPAIFRGESSVFESPAAGELARVLAAMIDPGDRGALRSALATGLLGQGAHELLTLDQDEDRAEAWLESFRRWGAAWREHGFPLAFQRLLGERDLVPRLLARSGGERRLTDLHHLGELLHAAGGGHLGPRSLLAWLGQMRAEARRGAAPGSEALQLRLESDAEAVQLLTVHRSKGLEFPVVYCPFLWQSEIDSKGRRQPFVRFHDPADGESLKLDLGSAELEAHRALAERESFAEGLRLAYVALTRAKRRLVLLWGHFSQVETSPLGFFLHPPEGEGDLLAAARDRKLGAEELAVEARGLARASRGTIALRELRAELDLGLARPAQGGRRLRPRRARRTLPDLFRTTSFSALVSGRQDSEEARDLDARREEPPLVDGGTEAPAAAGERVALADFPAGVGPGSLLHEILESLDFPRAATGGELASRVAESLERHGLDSRWRGPLVAALGDVLAAPLGPGVSPPSLSLAGIRRSERRDEMEFLFDATGPETLTRARLAEAFRRHGGSSELEAYAEDLGRLAFAPFRGFLKGFIDLVFEADGRWYVVDYKSNLLGPEHGDYHPEALAGAMRSRHYLLQACLYTVALDRHLRLRQPGYAYERSFGGVLYLFLRGMSGRFEPGRGVWAARPPAALVAELSRLLGPSRQGDAP